MIPVQFSPAMPLMGVENALPGGVYQIPSSSNVNVFSGPTAGFYPMDGTARYSPMPNLAKTGIRDVFDGSAGNEGALTSRTDISRVVPHGSIILTEGKHWPHSTKKFRLAGESDVTQLWTAGEAIFCVEDEADQEMAKKAFVHVSGPPMSAAVAMLSASQLTHLFREADWELAAACRSGPVAGGPPVVVVDGGGGHSTPFVRQTIESMSESEWYAAKPEVVQNLRDAISEQPKLLWNNIEHIRKYARFLGFLSSASEKPDLTATDITAVFSCDYNVPNYWGKSVRVGDYVGFIIKRPANVTAENRRPYAVYAWNCPDGPLPLMSELAYTDYAGKTHCGAFFCVGRVVFLDPPPGGYSRSEGERDLHEQRGLVGQLCGGRLSAREAIDESTRIARVALKRVRVNVAPAFPLSCDIGVIYTFFGPLVVSRPAEQQAAINILLGEAYRQYGVPERVLQSLVDQGADFDAVFSAATDYAAKHPTSRFNLPSSGATPTAPPAELASSPPGATPPSSEALPRIPSLFEPLFAPSAPPLTEAPSAPNRETLKASIGKLGLSKKSQYVGLYDLTAVDAASQIAAEIEAVARDISEKTKPITEAKSADLPVLHAGDIYATLVLAGSAIARLDHAFGCRVLADWFWIAGQGPCDELRDALRTQDADHIARVKTLASEFEAYLKYACEILEEARGAFSAADRIGAPRKLIEATTKNLKAVKAPSFSLTANWNEAVNELREFFDAIYRKTYAALGELFTNRGTMFTKMKYLEKQAGSSRLEASDMPIMAKSVLERVAVLEKLVGEVYADVTAVISKTVETIKGVATKFHGIEGDELQLAFQNWGRALVLVEAHIMTAFELIRDLASRVPYVPANYYAILSEPFARLDMDKADGYPALSLEPQLASLFMAKGNATTTNTAARIEEADDERVSDDEEDGLVLADVTRLRNAKRR